MLDNQFVESDVHSNGISGTKVLNSSRFIETHVIRVEAWFQLIFCFIAAAVDGREGAAVAGWWVASTEPKVC